MVIFVSKVFVSTVFLHSELQLHVPLTGNTDGNSVCDMDKYEISEFVPQQAGTGFRYPKL